MPIIHERFDERTFLGIDLLNYSCALSPLLRPCPIDTFCEMGKVTFSRIETRLFREFSTDKNVIIRFSKAKIYTFFLAFRFE